MKSPKRIRKRINLTIDPENYKWLKSRGISPSQVLDDAIRKMMRTKDRLKIEEEKLDLIAKQMDKQLKLVEKLRTRAEEIHEEAKEISLEDALEKFKAQYERLGYLDAHSIQAMALMLDMSPDELDKIAYDYVRSR